MDSPAAPKEDKPRSRKNKKSKNRNNVGENAAPTIDNGSNSAREKEEKQPLSDEIKARCRNRSNRHNHKNNKNPPPSDTSGSMEVDKKVTPKNNFTKTGFQLGFNTKRSDNIDFTSASKKNNGAGEKKRGAPRARNWIAESMKKVEPSVSPFNNDASPALPEISSLPPRNIKTISRPSKTYNPSSLLIHGQPGFGSPSMNKMEGEWFGALSPANLNVGGNVGAGAKGGFGNKAIRGMTKKLDS